MHAFLLAFGLFLLLLLLQAQLSRRESKHVFVNPQKGDRNTVSDAVLRGYQQFTRPSGKPFFVRYWQKDYMVLPVKYLPDVRRADRNHLVFLETISDVLFIYNWIGDLFKSNRMVAAVIKGINPQLSVLSDAMVQESLFAFEKELGITAGESKTFNTVELMTTIILRTMTRVIAGQGLSRNDEFLKATKVYYKSIFFTGFIMLKMPVSGWLRDFLAWPLYKYHQYFRQRPLIDMIKPIAESRLEEKFLGVSGDHDFDVIQCSLDRLHEFPFSDSNRTSPAHTLSHEVLQMIWAAGQSPAMTLSTILYKLLEDPSYIEPLRDEARLAVERHGWTDSIYRDLPKMDSFIREVHRLYPSFALNATRLVRDKPFVCSDGFTVPPGVRIAFPAEASQLDPDIITEPEKFEGFRFVRLAVEDIRQEDGVNHWAATHTSYSNLTFGYGNHACPGRFITIAS